MCFCICEVDFIDGRALVATIYCFSTALSKINITSLGLGLLWCDSLIGYVAVLHMKCTLVRSPKGAEDFLSPVMQKHRKEMPPPDARHRMFPQKVRKFQTPPAAIVPGEPAGQLEPSDERAQGLRGRKTVDWICDGA